jgi:16S rRNA C1402 N4-methylase RsmH
VPGYESEFIDLTKHPIVADKNELVSNPRARSAKLRAVVKIKTKERE